MLPYLAQGTNSALEDGAVLGTLLAQVKTKPQLGHALRRYESLRKKRGHVIAAEAFAQVGRLAAIMASTDQSASIHIHANKPCLPREISGICLTESLSKQGMLSCDAVLVQPIP